MMMADTAEIENLTPIQQFYSKSNIFITGGTGFLGKILLEKLLRSCSNLSSIYVLIRNKKGKNVHTRIDELFDDSIFERLREEQPKFRHKVVAVAGDCSLPDLGLSMQDRQLLINEINVIFHVAATVKFDEKIKMAVAINVRSPMDLLNLSRQMSNLKCFMHVSTAYANVPHRVIEERFCQSPVDSRKLIVLTEALNEKLLDNITPVLLDKWPNTYTYTKAVAEDVIRQEGHDLPVGVFRPAIVVSTYREPIGAWINNFYGPTGVSAGAGTGVLRTLHCDPQINANVIPVDMCVNSLIAAAWEVGENFKEFKKLKQVEPETETPEIPVYNYESSNDKPITWGRFMHLSECYGITNPSVKAIWYYYLTLQPTAIGYFFTCIFLHYLPAILVDGALLCVGKSPKMLKVYAKIHKFTKVISYFTTKNWTFRNERTRHLIDSMSEKDQEIFFCDLKKLDWNEFFKTYLKGIRIYLLQDPMETVGEAMAKWRRLYWCHQAVRAVAFYIFFRFLWFVVTTLYQFLI